MIARRAIVVGGGIVGIIAGQVLASRFERVLVLERDPAVTPRTHVPHQAHTHILGAYGLDLLSRLCPGLDARLEAAGAPRFDFGESPYFAGKWAPTGPFGLTSRSFTRALLERELRAILAAQPNVELVCGQKVDRIVLEGGRATAVVLDDGRTLMADLIVDAMGMASKTSQLLAANGFGTVPRSEVDLHGAALTRLYRPPHTDHGWVMFVVRPVGANLRSGAITYVEHGLWRVSVWGFGDCKPPRAPDAQLPFAKLLPTPRFAELLDGAEPVSEPYYYAASASRWLHYEALTALPDGLVIVGDATFRPNYHHGQGMTFCAMACELLGEHLDAGLGVEAGSSHAFQRAYAARMAPWWEWNLSMELQVPGAAVEGASPPDAVQRMSDYREMREAALDDPALWKLVMEINQGARLPQSARPDLRGTHR